MFVCPSTVPHPCQHTSMQRLSRYLKPLLEITNCNTRICDKRPLPRSQHGLKGALSPFVIDKTSPFRSQRYNSAGKLCDQDTSTSRARQENRNGQNRTYERDHVNSRSRSARICASPASVSTAAGSSRSSRLLADTLEKRQQHPKVVDLALASGTEHVVALLN